MLLFALLFTCLKLTVNGALSWTSALPSTMRTRIPFSTIGSVYAIQTLALTSSFSSTVTDTYTVPLSTNNYDMALGCLGIAMSSRIHFDTVLANRTAAGYTLNYTILSSAVATSFTYNFQIFIFAVDLSVNLPVSIKNSVDMSLIAFGNCDTYADSISASGVTLAVPLSQQVLSSCKTYPFIHAIMANTSTPMLNIVATLRPLATNPAISSFLLITNTVSNETRFRISYLIVDNSSLFYSSSTLFLSYSAGTNSGGTSSFPTISLSINRIAMGLSQYRSYTGSWSCNFVTVTCSGLGSFVSFSLLSFKNLVCPANSLIGATGCDCVLTYYQLSTSCLPCGRFCDVCTNNTFCTTCTPSTLRTPANGQC
jgi:hypothetical protein